MEQTTKERKQELLKSLDLLYNANCLDEYTADDILNKINELK